MVVTLGAAEFVWEGVGLWWIAETVGRTAGVSLSASARLVPATARPTHPEAAITATFRVIMRTHSSGVRDDDLDPRVREFVGQ